MDTVGGIEIKQQIVMLGQMIEALAARGNLVLSMPRQETGASVLSLRGNYNDETSRTGAQVRALLRSRRLRDELFGSDLFADPAWDMLLDLIAARLEHAQVSVSSLCIAASVPPTTALRWLRQLTDRGWYSARQTPKTAAASS